MKVPRIFVSNFPFARDDRKPLEILNAAGFEVVLNPYGRKLKPEETRDLAMECEGIVAGTENLLPLVQASPKLKFISRIGIGLDNVPFDLCHQRGIEVAFTPDAVTPAVTELTIGLMISLTRKVGFSDREIRKGGWSRPYGKRLGKSRIGIIGFGRVGFGVACLLLPFGPEEVLVNDVVNIENKIQGLRDQGLNIRETEKSEIFSVSDIVSLHLPLTLKTKNIVNRETLSRMKPESVLLNTARGELVNEEDLYDALHSKRLSGAALDVFTHEPYKGKLTDLENVLLTQHIGSCAYDCRLQMEVEAAESVLDFFSGKPVVRKVTARDIYS